MCSKSGECFVPIEPDNVECRNGVCQCKLTYTTDAKQNTCIRPRAKSKKCRVISSESSLISLIDLTDSSKSTSPLKVITLMLIASAVMITGSALKDAYYP